MKPSILTLCLLLAGCNQMGLVHGPNERVVFLDGSESLVPIDPVRLNAAYNYKAVTVNQDVADAAATLFTWRGGTVRPLSPVNVRGHRDSEGNLLIEWTRRSRIGQGLKPFSDVPIAEERERYEIDILDGSNNVLRTIKTDLTQGEPAILVPTFNYAGTSFVTGNSVTGEAVAYVQQRLERPGSFVEARLSSADAFGQLQLIEPQYGPLADQIGLLDLPIYRVRLSFGGPASGTPGIRLTENAIGDPAPGDLKFYSGSLGVVSAARLRMVIEATGVSYYWDYTGNGSVPFYKSDISIPLPLTVIAQVTGTAEVQDVFVGRRDTPSTTYSAENQTLDFGSVQGAVRVRVYQISSIVGRGAYCQATI